MSMERETLSERLGYPISPECHARLSLYVTLLLKWNRTINLIGRGTEKDVWTRHVLDSLQLHYLFPDTAHPKVLDVGSGAGLPGMILALSYPGEYFLVESDRRKSLFLNTVSRETASPSLWVGERSSITIINERVEKTPPIKPDIITARAFASIHDTLTLLRHQLHDGVICLFPKGANWCSDVEEAQEHWQFDVSHHPSRSHSSGTTVKISNITAS